MACVARPTKVYINVKSLIDNLNISRSLKTYMLVWPISKTKSMDIVRYIPIYAEEEESDADESDGSNDDADSPSGSETDADDSSDCDSESDADTDTEPETDYETDDDSDEDNASDDQFSDKEYNIGRFIVHRLAESPTLTEIVICITSKHLNDATLRLKHLEKEIKIVYLVQRDSTPMYDVILSVWKHFLTCVILYNFDRVKFKIKYDLTRINEIAPQLQKLEDKWAGGDDLLWQMFMKSLYLPKGTLVSPFSSASQPPSWTV
ncbi:hypothetical protein I316_03473 [Kwoniella heveanensis BCC8398]|uniref:Uncharacterized protein n=1 Tax=Kwoniella heveanensis BCC8398 TaxID=1296120 RepID=A0A1B9GV50_9TREE|nr:hypothetical protein I316_03473 [Kwoniella heveanensis BCC8398]